MTWYTESLCTTLRWHKTQRNAQRKVAWFGHEWIPGTHDVLYRLVPIFDLPHSQLRHGALDKSLRPNGVYRNGDHQSTNALKEEREVHLAQAVMIYFFLCFCDLTYRKSVHNDALAAGHKINSPRNLVWFGRDSIPGSLTPWHRSLCAYFNRSLCQLRHGASDKFRLQMTQSMRWRPS